MPKVDFKAYSKPMRERLPTDLEIVVSVYGPYLSAKDVMDCMKLGRTTVNDLLVSGSLPSTLTGPRGSRLVSAVDLVRYLHSQRHSA